MKVKCIPPGAYVLPNILFVLVGKIIICSLRVDGLRNDFYFRVNEMISEDQGKTIRYLFTLEMG